MPEAGKVGRIVVLVILMASSLWAQWEHLPEDTIVLIFGGDVMLARNVGKAISQYNTDYPFEGIRDILRSADLAVVNLESTVGTQTRAVNKKYVFRAEPAVLNGLVRAGVDAVSLANNHIFDYFSAGVVETVDSVLSAGIVPIGAGRNKSEFFRPHSFWINGHWFAILAVNDTRSGYWGYEHPGCAPTWTSEGESTAVALIESLAAAGANVIVFEHWGWEYQQFPSRRQRKLAHRFIRAGAKVVVGSHPHRLQGVEFFLNGVIIYSLGNLIFDQHDTLGNIGALARITFCGDFIESVELIPTETLTRFAQPHPASADSLLPYFARLSKPFGTRVVSDGQAIKLLPPRLTGED